MKRNPVTGRNSPDPKGKDQPGRKALASGEGSATDLVPTTYPALLAEIKARIRSARVRASLAASHEMLQLYWDIGRMILTRQRREGWGARVVDRLSADLRRAFPEQGGFSPRNLKYMRAFAEAWPEFSFVHQPVAQMGTSPATPSVGVQAPLAQTATAAAAIVQQAAAQLPWKMNFYLSAVDDRFRRPGDQPSIGLILCRTKNRVIAEYALRDLKKPVGVSAYVTRLVARLPAPLKDAVPSIAALERGLKDLPS